MISRRRLHPNLTSWRSSLARGTISWTQAVWTTLPTTLISTKVSPHLSSLIKLTHFLAVPSYVDYVEDPMEYSQYQQDYPLYGEIGGGDLRVLSKENDSQDFEPDHESPRTPKKPQAITSVRPPPEPVSRMTQERRGMLEVPILRPEEARDPKFLFRGRKKRSIPTSAKKD